ncbi:predicted protein [Streptomyces viridochromogenes DSM 40736]|uniref:Predicted protein n=1 Tax=Streptomyces viridochromogenes (strain DSM 40736 / JCM 4977 / BCRC 1201 / Tue 494) TaxID=591159 RepID=D9X080_STRVT|nr:predicted protein [Streptomyces viridochromogenes DSM 40736]
MRASPYESRQGTTGSGHGAISSKSPLLSRNSLQESAMADLAFVVTTIVLFALVAFVAKGVTKL